MRAAFRTTLSIIAAILTSLIAQCQHFIDLSTIDPHRSDLPPDPVAHGLIVDSVITAFDPAASIGWVQKGLANRQENAFFLRDARVELKAVLDRLHTGGAEGRHVVLKVDTIEISELTLATKELAICRFAAEVLIHSDSGWTSVYPFGITLANGGGLDATDDHATNIVSALDHCLRRTARALDRSEGTPRGISDRQLHRPFVRHLPDVLSITGTIAKKGIYNTFMDLVDGTPDTTVVVEWKESPNSTESTRVLRPKGGNWDLNVWGFSDGERLYVNTGKDYNEVHFSNSGPYTYWTPQASTSANTGLVLGAGFFFGPIGAAIAVASSSETGGAPVRLDMDLIAGSLQRTHGPKASTRNSEHWFCYSRHSKMDTTACLFVYGGEEACLREGQFHVVRLVPRVDPVPLEVQAGAQRVPIQLDTNASTDQVYLMTIKEDGTLKVDKLNAAMASDIIERANPEMEVK